MGLSGHLTITTVGCSLCWTPGPSGALNTWRAAYLVVGGHMVVTGAQ
jgi:hypothetical protein